MVIQGGKQHARCSMSARDWLPAGAMVSDWWRRTRVLGLGGGLALSVAAAAPQSAGPQDVHAPEWTAQPIHTSDREAQREFDRGLLLVYSFDHEEAVKAFQRAAELDPAASMPYWGIALALGPNLNDLRMEGRMAAAHGAVQRALQLARDGPQRELDYARTLSKRYTAETTFALPQLYRAYADAMRELAARYRTISTPKRSSLKV
jgi:tetratricopeptide (TPR) repeat protein